MRSTARSGPQPFEFHHGCRKKKSLTRRLHKRRKPVTRCSPSRFISDACDRTSMRVGAKMILQFRIARASEHVKIRPRQTTSTNLPLTDSVRRRLNLLFDFHIFSKLFSMFALEEIMTDATLYASAHGTRSHALAYLVAKLKHSHTAVFLQTSRRPLETFW